MLLLLSRSLWAVLSHARVACSFFGWPLCRVSWNVLISYWAAVLTR